MSFGAGHPFGRPMAGARSGFATGHGRMRLNIKRSKTTLAPISRLSTEFYQAVASHEA